MQISRINIDHSGNYGTGEIAVTSTTGLFYEFRIHDMDGWPGFARVCDKPLKEMTPDEFAAVIAFCVKMALTDGAG